MSEMIVDIVQERAELAERLVEAEAEIAELRAQLAAKDVQVEAWRSTGTVFEEAFYEIDPETAETLGNLGDEYIAKARALDAEATASEEPT